MKKTAIITTIALFFMFSIIINFSTQLVVSIPSLIIDNALNNLFGVKESKKSEEQEKHIRDYTLIAQEVMDRKDELIEDEKDKLSHCDEIKVKDNFLINWIDIISVDSIRVQQNFRKFSKKKAKEIGEKFINISSYTYTETRTSTSKDAQGNTITTEYIVTIGVVEVSKNSLQDPIFKNYYLKNDFQKSADNAEYMYNFLSTIYVDESVENDADKYFVNSEIVEVSGENVITLNYYNQRKGSHANKPYGPNSNYSDYATAGCGPTAAAIIFSSLKNDKSITPETMGNLFSKKGLRSPNAGTSWSCMTVAAKEYKMKSEYFSPSKQKLVSHLQKGAVVSTVQGKRNNALYTGAGHFIVLNGIRENNGKIEVYVTDPAYEKKIGWWDIDVVLEGSKNMTAIWE